MKSSRSFMTTTGKFSAAGVYTLHGDLNVVLITEKFPLQNHLVT